MNIKKFLVKITDLFSRRYVCFIAFDKVSISCVLCSILKVHNNYVVEKVVDQASVSSSGVSIDQISDVTAFTDSVARCLDIIENRSRIRVTHMIVSPIINGTYHKPYNIIVDNDIGLDPVVGYGKYIDPRAMNYTLGKNFFFTNCKFFQSVVHPENSKLLQIELLLSGYKNSVISALSRSSNSLSISISSIICTSIVLPMIAVPATKDTMIIYITSFVVIIGGCRSDTIEFGDDIVFQELSNKTGIPYDVLLNNKLYIQEVFSSKNSELNFINKSQTRSIVKSLEVNGFIIQNFDQVISECIENYIKKLKNILIYQYQGDGLDIVFVNQSGGWLNKALFSETFKDLGSVDLISVEDYVYGMSIASCSDAVILGMIRYYNQNYSLDVGQTHFANRYKKQIKELYREGLS